ncbi:TetR/AcrR family transcriptional regulator [Streptomyces tendae]|uniref:TetR/AcrR family transcriptional regulator n=1 Tax=Streptomyces tendae TaxID=1932 RepID=UPI0033DCD193
MAGQLRGQVVHGSQSTPDARRETPGERRAQLVEAAVDHVAAHGIADLSLRRLGAAIGASHRMLIHYFGSKEQLLVEIVRASERRQRELLSHLRSQPGLPPADVARLLWRQLTDPGVAGQERLFFEICGQALRGRPEAAPILEGLVSDWLEPLAAAEAAAGASPGAARSRARPGLATVRGLLLDLLATGDRAGVDSAMEEFLRLYYGAE